MPSAKIGIWQPPKNGLIQICNVTQNKKALYKRLFIMGYFWFCFSFSSQNVAFLMPNLAGLN